MLTVSASLLQSLRRCVRMVDLGRVRASLRVSDRTRNEEDSVAHEETTEMFELCFTPVPESAEPNVGPSAHIYRYVVGRRSRTEGPFTEDTPASDRVGAEVFALRHGFMRDGDWRVTDAGYDSVILARIG